MATKKIKRWRIYDGDDVLAERETKKEATELAKELAHSRNVAYLVELQRVRTLDELASEEKIHWADDDESMVEPERPAELEVRPHEIEIGFAVRSDRDGGHVCGPFLDPIQAEREAERLSREQRLYREENGDPHPTLQLKPDRAQAIAEELARDAAAAGQQDLADSLKEVAAAGKLARPPEDPIELEPNAPTTYSVHEVEMPEEAAA